MPLIGHVIDLPFISAGHKPCNLPSKRMWRMVIGKYPLLTHYIVGRNEKRIVLRPPTHFVVAVGADEPILPKSHSRSIPSQFAPFSIASGKTKALIGVVETVPGVMEVMMTARGQEWMTFGWVG